MDYLFVFRSLTAAKQGAKVLSAAGIRSAVVRSPGSISSRGCGYGVKVGEKSGAEAKRVFKTASSRPTGVYAMDGISSVKEVRF